MPDFICPCCLQPVRPGVDPTRSSCAGCGRALAFTDTRVTAQQDLTTAAIRASAEEWSAATTPGVAPTVPATAPYASWDEFRATAPAVQHALAELATEALPDLSIAPLRLPPAQIDTDDLGALQMSFTVDGDNGPLTFISAAALAAAALLILGLSLTADELPGQPWSLARFFLGLPWAGSAGLFGYWLAFVRPAAPTVDYWLFEDGILWRRGGAFASCPWENVEDVDERPQGRVACLRFRPAADFHAVISAAGRPERRPVIEFLVTKLTGARFVPLLCRLCAGERVSFGALILDRQAIRGLGFHEPWSNVARVVSDDRHLLVELRDDPTWRSVARDAISSPRLALLLAHILVEEAGRLPPLSRENGRRWP
ncbi:MAG: hypothetical protein U0793_01815 [Gemmataceae bacterium]